ncbi:pseudouridine synthase [soil metagenome]
MKAKESGVKMSEFEGDRIAKVIARAGVCSRRDAERFIAEGRVMLNGTVLASPAVNVKDSDDIRVDGKALPRQEPMRLWRYHKPAGLVVSHKDPEGRPTVFEALKDRLPRVISIGRLDLNTEGLLLLTNDGELARLLELPATGWVRRYRVRAHGRGDPEALAALKDGITIEGIHYGPIEAAVEKQQGANVWLDFAIREGKNREVKKVCDHLRLEVNRLIRTTFGPFTLGDLARDAIAEVPPRDLRAHLGQKPQLPEPNADRRRHAQRA